MATRVRPSNQVILESSTAVGGSIDLFVATRFGNTRRTAPNEFFSVGLCFVESDAVFCNVVPRIAGLALDPEGLDSGRFVSRSADAVVINQHNEPIMNRKRQDQKAIND